MEFSRGMKEPELRIGKVLLQIFLMKQFKCTDQIGNLSQSVVLDITVFENDIVKSCIEHGIQYGGNLFLTVVIIHLDVIK